ncbi:MAG: hypothetical protein NC402_02930 [Prevotella sp.]|nr:hypothetical protein [Prevotella sp.]MCM1074779.1 hypothetical protein [Ruminococcus sp.]
MRAIAKKLVLVMVLLLSTVLASNAQLPNGFNRNYSLTGTYNSSGNSISDPGAAPKASVMIVTTNFGFIQSSAICTLNFGYTGSSTLTFNRFAGCQNGWFIYSSDMGPAGSSSLLISTDGNVMRLEKAWSGGEFWEYEAN